jgi:predicted Zn-dependent protease
MAKAFTHFVILALLFFGIWFLLSNVNFVEIFHVEQFTKDNEHKLGEFILDAVRRGNDELDSDTVQTCLDSIKNRLCTANDIADSSISIHILVKDDVNAFALPDRHLVVYTGLIRYCKSPEELEGVLAHEIAHMEHRHVMKKLVKEVGFSMLTAVAGGESSGEIGRQVVKLLSSTAFDREQESEADRSAVHMMANAGIDPESLANFLFRLSQEKKNIPKNFEWVSTHPNSQDRSAEILKLMKRETFRLRPVVNGYVWVSARRIASEAHEN